MEGNKEPQPLPLTEAIDDHPPPNPPQDNIVQPLQPNELIQQPQLLIHPSLEITLRPPIVINLDDDDEEQIKKIDEEVDNNLKSLFSSTMSLNYKSSIPTKEPSTSPSSTLAILPFEIQPPSQYTEHDWEEDDLLVS